MSDGYDHENSNPTKAIMWVAFECGGKIVYHNIRVDDGFKLVITQIR